MRACSLTSLLTVIVCAMQPMLSQSFRSLQAAKLYKVPKGAEGSADGGKALFSLLNVSAAKVTPNPYPHLLVENFLSPQALRVINEDFPELLDVVGQQERPEAVLADRFGVDLTKCHTRFSMRGISVPEDGHVHTDDYKKVVTVLIYLNEHWNHNGPGGSRVAAQRSRWSPPAAEQRLAGGRGGTGASVGGAAASIRKHVPHHAWLARLHKLLGPAPRDPDQLDDEMRKNKYVSLKELKEKLKEAREKRDADNKIRAKAVTKVQAAAEVLSKNPKIKKAKSKLAVAAGDVL
eukprot:CAMPEP_0114310554 /NCGR_PEP_ID=MMETSP0059-20121206/19313_1 /TAXON_ID=36894 /ORGANISM="Pyramimonas parkeae, Strain CCMP726" /LENGTH=290 /DNA_ID=CAMNT_0001434589 /DNA_START=186 /DNA_END=1060 /DNA_ORIENTATION=+